MHCERAEFWRTTRAGLDEINERATRAPCPLHAAEGTTRGYPKQCSRLQRRGDEMIAYEGLRTYWRPVDMDNSCCPSPRVSMEVYEGRFPDGGSPGRGVIVIKRRSA